MLMESEIGKRKKVPAFGGAAIYSKRKNNLPYL